MDSLRSQVASTVVAEYADADAYDGGAGPATPAAEMTEDSEVLLTNVTLVSEDTGATGEAMAASSARLQDLNHRRVDVRARTKAAAGVEQNLRSQEQRVDSRAAAANAVLDELEAEAAAKRAARAAERMAKSGGPAVGYAKAQVGDSYVYGAAGPDAFDCSGLTMMAWQQAGVRLPHSSSAQYAGGQHISESELQPGDLVFYYSPISHVGIYIGDGQTVSALNPGSGVQVSGLHDMPYAGAARVG
jgi:cell wall-associated NlpC family hydrolase